MSRDRRSITARGESGQELSLTFRMASALVRRPHTRSTLVRQGVFSAAIAVLWLLAGLGRLAGGGRFLTGFLFLGAAFFGLATLACRIVLVSTPPDDDASTDAENSLET